MIELKVEHFNFSILVGTRIWLDPKFHIRTKIKLEEFNTNSRFSEWWVSSN